MHTYMQCDSMNVFKISTILMTNIELFVLFLSIKEIT